MEMEKAALCYTIDLLNLDSVLSISTLKARVESNKDTCRSPTVRRGKMIGLWHVTLMKEIGPPPLGRYTCMSYI